MHQLKFHGVNHNFLSRDTSFGDVVRITYFYFFFDNIEAVKLEISMFLSAWYFIDGAAYLSV